MNRPWLMLIAFVSIAGCNKQASYAPARGNAPPPPPSVAPPEESPIRFVERCSVDDCTSNNQEINQVPVVLAMHGLGDTPENFLRIFPMPSRPARVLALEAIDPYRNGGRAWFPLRTVEGVEQPEAFRQGLLRAGEAVHRFLQYLDRQRGSRTRVVLTGFSQGAMLSYAYAAIHPERVIAAIPVSGFLHERIEALSPNQDALVPWPEVHALHGDSDEMVDVALDRASIVRLRGLGWTADLVEFPGLSHRVNLDVQTRWRTLLNQAVSPIRAPSENTPGHPLLPRAGQ